MHSLNLRTCIHRIDTERCSAVAESDRIACGAHLPDQAADDEGVCSDDLGCCFVADNAAGEGGAAAQCFYPAGHECYEIQCLNGGYCVEDEGEVYCQCVDLYLGDRCEEGMCE